MTWDEVITAIVYIVAIFILFLLGKWFYDRTHPSFRMKEELVEKDNLALALDLFGYFSGIVLALGGVLIGPSAGVWEDLLDIAIYGIVAIALLNLSIWINNKIIFPRFDNYKEIIHDRNVGVGAVQAGNHIAIGLIVYGAISGEGGDVVTAAVFWLLGQLGLILASRIYDWITPFNVQAELEKDNVAVGVAMAGMFIAIGNVVRLGSMGDFVSWSENLATFGQFYVFGIVLLPFMRLATDKLILPGARLTDELVRQEKPNVGAGLLEAFAYIGASFLLGWVV